MQVTPKQLWQFCSYEEDAYTSFASITEDEDTFLTEELWATLKSLDLRVVVASWEMSENHLGGNDINDMLISCSETAARGYAIFNWYGDGSEVLCVGYRQNQLQPGENMDAPLTILEGSQPEVIFNVYMDDGLTQDDIFNILMFPYLDNGHNWDTSRVISYRFANQVDVADPNMLYVVVWSGRPEPTMDEIRQKYLELNGDKNEEDQAK